MKQFALNQLKSSEYISDFPVEVRLELGQYSEKNSSPFRIKSIIF